jgi:hypothetical protein
MYLRQEAGCALPANYTQRLLQNIIHFADRPHRTVI